jgi:septal ring factor EnvC (AmiA/AmiB activator)
VRLLILYCFIVISLIYGATSTTKKIKSSKKDLSAVTSQKKKASRHLDKIAKDIKKAEKEIDFLDKKIDELSKDQNKTEEKYISLKIELKKSTYDFEQTSKELEQKRKKFISLLSEQFSITFAMEQAHAPTRKSIISQEIYKAYKKQNIKMLEALKLDISKLKKHKEDKLYLRNKTQNQIKRIIKKRDNYAQKKEEKKQLLKKLSVDEEKYNAKLSKIADKQNALNATLAKLNILHTKEVEEARKQAAARKEAIRLEKER